MYRRILVLLDGSTRAERAIPLAARIVRATGGTLILVDIVFSLTTAVSGETELAQAEDYLAYSISSTYADALTGIPIERSIIMEGEASIIFATVLLEQADMLVVGSCDEDESEHGIIGSVARKAIHRSPVPVLIVPEDYADLPDPLDGSPLNMLVPLDGSPEAEAALEPAAQLITLLAAPASAVLQVLHVVRNIAPAKSLQGNNNIDAFTQEEKIRRKAATYMKSLERRLFSLVETNDHLLVKSSVEWCSSVSRTILEAQRTCSMLAMAPREQGGVALALIASVIEQVLQRTKLPIFIIRSRLSEIQIQPILPKEVLLFKDDEHDGEDENEDEECVAWSLSGYNIDPPSFYPY
jgi:nucleotide-binding universal stress UspA family protein